MAVSSFKVLRQTPEGVAALLLTAVLVWLHFNFATHAGGLWRDEVNLVNLSGRAAFGDMARDSFPVLMPLSVRGWAALGMARRDEGLRFLGALIGLGLVASLWVSARATRRSLPLLSLALLALNSTVIMYGDSLRGYGLGSLLIVLTVGAAGAYLRKATPAQAGWLALGAVLSVQALYQNAVFVGAICLGCGAVCARRRAWRTALPVLGAGAAAALSLLPYVPILVSGRSSMEVLRTSLRFKYLVENVAIAAGFPLSLYAWIWLLLAGIILVGAVFRRRSGRPFPPGHDEAADEMRLFAATTLLAGGAGFVWFLWLAGLTTQPWYFVPLLALAAACFDAGLPSWSRPGRVVFFGSIVGTALIAVPAAHRDLSLGRFTNVDAVSGQLTAAASPDDFVVVTPWYCGISFERYFKSPPAWTTLPPLADHSTHRYDLVRSRMQDTNAIQSVLDQAAATLRSGRRVWVVSEAGLMGIPEPNTPSPYHLPPPPLPKWGWSGVPYALQWSSQAAHFLGNHSRRFERVENPVPDKRRLTEKMDLFVASGWRDVNPTNSP
jgi:hypothetical protein